MVPVAHYAVGMFPAFVISVALAPLRKRWLVYAPVVITFCGLWALIPDVFVYYGRKFQTDEMRWLMHDTLGDIFFFHKTLDRWAGEHAESYSMSPGGASHATARPGPRVHPQVGGVWGLVLVVCMYSVVILGYLVYIRSLRRELDVSKAKIQALTSRLAACGSGPSVEHNL